MGLIGTLRGEGILASALWALISGFIIAVLTRTLRRALRRNLDSSLRDEDLLHELAVVVVPIEEGRLGKARVVKYGRETEVYARLSNGRANKGETIRLLRRINGEYLAVRAADLDAGIEKGDEPWTES
jgi:membrane protein implicated in regulation of membrane protease activity